MAEQTKLTRKRIRELQAALEQNYPLKHPVMIRQTKRGLGDAHADEGIVKRNGKRYIQIRLNPDDSRSVQIWALFHEWAHAYTEWLPHTGKQETEDEYHDEVFAAVQAAVLTTMRNILHGVLTERMMREIQ